MPLLMMQINPENCPVTPPRPGNWWVGEVEDDITDQVIEGQSSITLKNAWVYISHVEVVKDQVAPGKIQVGLGKLGMIAPIFHHASSKGEELRVPVTVWMWPSASTEYDLKDQMQEAGIKIMTERSNLSIASAIPTRPIQ